MTTKRSYNPNHSGTYALVIFLPRAQTIRIGALGEFNFPRGYYMYIGSAMNGLSARIARHLVDNRLATRAKNKPRNSMERLQLAKTKLFWHIDYFLQHARVTHVMTHTGSERFECLWAQAALALPKAKIVAPRFGASDCDCVTHLVYVGKQRMKDKR